MSGDPAILTPAELWRAAGWVQRPCGCCAGLEWGGEYPRECRSCKGQGLLWISPQRRLALYPGGPLVGSEPR